MKYDFTSIMDRRGRDALAIDSVGEKVWGSEPHLSVCHGCHNEESAAPCIRIFPTVRRIL